MLLSIGPFFQKIKEATESQMIIPALVTELLFPKRHLHQGRVTDPNWTPWKVFRGGLRGLGRRNGYIWG